MTNPYETCPIFENENYCLKFVDASDAENLLRLDLRSDYEQESAIFEILSLIIPPAFALIFYFIIAFL